VNPLCRTLLASCLASAPLAGAIGAAPSGDPGCPHARAAAAAGDALPAWRAHDTVCWSQNPGACTTASAAAEPPGAVRAAAGGLPPALFDACLAPTLFGDGFEPGGAGPQASGAPQRWSDPATWGGSVPAAGANVLVPRGSLVVLDVATPPLGTLTVEGLLVSAMDRDIGLTARAIMVHGGTLRFGCTTRPFAQRASITLTGEASEENLHGMGTKFLGAMEGGTIELNGLPRTAWTKLDGTAEPGATTIRVLDAGGWAAGDRIVVGATDYEPAETTTRRIAAVAGNLLTLDAPLAHRHWGRVQALGTTGASLDQRAPVGLLSRNIVLRGDNGPGSTFGGHLMFMAGSRVNLRHVEVTGMGQLGRVGRYPVHWHIAGESGRGSGIEGSAIHGSLQRGIVVHRTNDLVVRDNVVFDTVGHMVFIESSNEVRNTFERNLLLLTRPVPVAQRNPTIEFEHLTDEVSGFWISNLHNRFVDNHVGAILHGHGYWIADGAFSTQRDRDFCLNGVINEPFGGCHLNISTLYADVRAAASLLEFRGNLAHSIRGAAEWGGSFHFGPAGTGLFIDDLPVATGQVAVFRDFRAFKIGQSAVWGTMRHNAPTPRAVRTPTVDGLVVADVRTATFNAEHHRSMAIRNAVLYGPTDNQPPGTTAATRDWYALFVSHGNSTDDRTVDAVAVYPFIPASSNNLTPQVVAAFPPTTIGEPRFTEWVNVRLQGWRN
jgi:hypothetical protein